MLRFDLTGPPPSQPIGNPESRKRHRYDNRRASHEQIGLAVEHGVDKKRAQAGKAEKGSMMTVPPIR